MTPEIETPGASGNATEGEIETEQFHDTQYRVRKEWAIAAWFALDHCDRQDILHICETWLADLATDGPTIGDPFGMVAADALFWADCAPAHELAAYGCAALDKLHGCSVGINIRKRLFAKLWKAFDKRDRLAFLARVDVEGKFLNRGAV
jgi:hypothetical protein